MRWSKLKQIAEERLADTLQGRIQYYSTVYTNNSAIVDAGGRGWITLDGEEIFNFSDPKHEIELYKTFGELLEERNNPDWRNPEENEQYHNTWDETHDRLREDGVFARWEFHPALFDYIHMSVEEALNSKSPLQRAFAMFDRRLGKRRLREIQFTGKGDSIPRKCYEIRCEAEGIRPTEYPTPDI